MAPNCATVWCVWAALLSSELPPNRLEVFTVIVTVTFSHRGALGEGVATELSCWIA